MVLESSCLFPMGFGRPQPFFSFTWDWLNFLCGDFISVVSFLLVRFRIVNASGLVATISSPTSYFD